MFYFFFSSRRRHTRLQGDWSSDVCSSDLEQQPGDRPRAAARLSLKYAGKTSHARYAETRAGSSQRDDRTRPAARRGPRRRVGGRTRTSLPPDDLWDAADVDALW